jgi:hypothetical protein
METLLDTPEVETLYGWYYRTSTGEYEFWWGNRCMLSVHEVTLDVMPYYLSTEIRASATVKAPLDN